MTGQDIYCTHTHTHTQMSGFQHNDKSGADTPSGARPALRMRCYQPHSLPTSEQEVMFLYPPPLKTMEKKIWELIGNMFKCPAWSVRLGRKSRFKLWKQSAALKTQLRHNWNHHRAQKPAGNPPHAPWCQHTWFQAGTKITTKRVRGAEHWASFQI